MGFRHGAVGPQGQSVHRYIIDPGSINPCGPAEDLVRSAERAVPDAALRRACPAGRTGHLDKSLRIVGTHRRETCVGVGLRLSCAEASANRAAGYVRGPGTLRVHGAAALGAANRPLRGAASRTGRRERHCRRSIAFVDSGVEEERQTARTPRSGAGGFDGIPPVADSENQYGVARPQGQPHRFDKGRVIVAMATPVRPPDRVEFTEKDVHGSCLFPDSTRRTFSFSSKMSIVSMNLRWRNSINPPETIKLATRLLACTNLLAADIKGLAGS